MLKKAQVENGNSTLLPEGDPYVLQQKNKREEKGGEGSEKKKKKSNKEKERKVL